MSSPPTNPGPLSKPPASSPGLDNYNTVAETIGGPSLRLKDNVIQAAIVIGCTALGAIAGYIYNDWIGALVGGAGAMIASTLISGIVLMVIGWMRAAKRVK